MKRFAWLAAVALVGALACKSPNPETPAPQGPEAAKPAAEAPKPVEPAKPADAQLVTPTKYEGAVAKVNGEEVGAAAFNVELEKVVKPGSQLPKDRLERIETNILDRMIDDLLVAQAVKGGGVTVTDAEFADEYSKYKARFKTDEQYQNFLKYGKMTEDEVRGRVKDKAALKKLLAQKYGLGVTEEEVKAFYEKNNRFYKERATVHIKQILLRFPKDATDEQVKAVEKKVEEVQAALRNGPFEEVAKKFSEDLSAQKGGDMEPITRGRYLKAVEDAAFAMKPNEISKPLKTQVGYHVIKLVEKAEERLKTFDEVKDQIMETLSNRNFYTAKRKLVDELKQSAQVERLVGNKGGPAAAAGLPVRGPAAAGAVVPPPVPAAAGTTAPAGAMAPVPAAPVAPVAPAAPAPAPEAPKTGN